jgi:hypothetical protein
MPPIEQSIEQVAKHVVFKAEHDTIELIFKRLLGKAQLPNSLEKRVELLLEHMPDVARPNPNYVFITYDKAHMCIFVKHALAKHLNIESYKDELMVYYGKKKDNDAMGFFAEMLMCASMGC